MNAAVQTPQTPAVDSTEAEIAALEQLCDRLLGFGVQTSVEWIDGFLTGLATAPTLPAPERWIPALSNDQFDRVFADPTDRAQALQVLSTRLNVVREQLNPQRLIDRDGELWLLPLIHAWDDSLHPGWQQDDALRAERAEVIAGMAADWAHGLVSAVSALTSDGAAGDVENPGAGKRWDKVRSDLLDHIAVLASDHTGDEYRAHLARHYPARKSGPEVSREVLVETAIFAVQRLRVEWLEHELTPATRQVTPNPGRNDPCPCGSGRKFKKCHGS